MGSDCSTLPRPQNENGETLLHVAVDANNASMVRLLLQSGADPNSKVGKLLCSARLVCQC